MQTARSIQNTNKVWVTAVALLCGAASSCAEDLQVWLDIDEATSLTEKTSLHGKQALRLKDNGGELATYFGDIGIRYKAQSWLQLGLFYRQLYDKDTDTNDWSAENRPFINSTLSWNWKNVHIANRTRMEYRMRETPKNEFRFRNQFSEVFSKSVTGWNLHPYLTQELFLNEDAARLSEASRFRFAFGLRSDPDDHFLFLGKKPDTNRTFKTDWYFVYESQEQGEGWVDTFATGFKLGVKF